MLPSQVRRPRPRLLLPQDPNDLLFREGAFIEARGRNRAALGQVIDCEVVELILGCSQLATLKEATERRLGRLPIKPGQRAE